jgi:aspartate/glutamate racemase
MINLIGAMAEEGMSYYELLNEDGKKRLERLHSTYVTFWFGLRTTALLD